MANEETSREDILERFRYLIGTDAGRAASEHALLDTQDNRRDGTYYEQRYGSPEIEDDGRPPIGFRMIARVQEIYEAKELERKSRENCTPENIEKHLE